jgi:hypothetical protein
MSEHRKQFYCTQNTIHFAIRAGNVISVFWNDDQYLISNLSNNIEFRHSKEFWDSTIAPTLVPIKPCALASLIFGVKFE